jgi:hypothetical protein
MAPFLRPPNPFLQIGNRCTAIALSLEGVACRRNFMMMELQELALEESRLLTELKSLKSLVEAPFAESAHVNLQAPATRSVSGTQPADSELSQVLDQFQEKDLTVMNINDVRERFHIETPPDLDSLDGDSEVGILLPFLEMHIGGETEDHLSALTDPRCQSGSLDYTTMTIQEIRKRVHVETPEQLSQLNTQQQAILWHFLHKTIRIGDHAFHSEPKIRKGTDVAWFFNGGSGIGKRKQEIATKYRNLYLLFKERKFPWDEEALDQSMYKVNRNAKKKG